MSTRLILIGFSAQFCLTEVGHGLDIANLETTADLMSNGDICLSTPSPSAAKSVAFAKFQFSCEVLLLISIICRFMPPTIPAGTPCVAIVWARLKVGTDDRGIRPFVVPLNDGKSMYPGITAK